MKNILITGIVSALMLSGSAFADKPVRNVSPARHPNLAQAQKLSQQAFDRVIAAQRANEWDLGGHARKAKELLEQVNIELKAAAETANEHH